MKRLINVVLPLLLLVAVAAGQNYNFELTQQNAYLWNPVFTMPIAGYVTLTVDSRGPVSGCGSSSVVMLWPGDTAGPVTSVELENGGSQWSDTTQFELWKGEQVGVEGSGGVGWCEPLPLDVSLSISTENGRPAPTPEPSSLMLIASGIVALLAYGARRFIGFARKG